MKKFKKPITKKIKHKKKVIYPPFDFDIGHNKFIKTLFVILMILFAVPALIGAIYILIYNLKNKPADEKVQKINNKEEN